MTRPKKARLVDGLVPFSQLPVWPHRPNSPKICSFSVSTVTAASHRAPPCRPTSLKVGTPGLRDPPQPPRLWDWSPSLPRSALVKVLWFPKSTRLSHSTFTSMSAVPRGLWE